MIPLEARIPGGLERLNARDLGGLPRRDGGLTPTRAFYRTAQLSSARPDELARVRSLGLRTVVDFRTDREIARHGPVPALGARVVRIPLDQGDFEREIPRALYRGGTAAISETLLEDVYRALIATRQVEYGRFLRLARDPANWPLSFMCVHGKDRTGVGALLLLASLGATPDAIVSDYLATMQQRVAARGRAKRRLRIGIPLLRLRHGTPQDPSRILRLLEVRESCLDAAYAEMERVAGSVDQYVARVGEGGLPAPERA